VRIKPLSIAELNSWRPAGTVFKVIEIPQSSLEDATKGLREVGLRVTVRETEHKHARIEVFRHHGMPNPPGEIQQVQHELTDGTLDGLKIPYTSRGQGVTFGGGTPNHRWLDVRVNGDPFVLKVLVATEAELARQLDALARGLRIPVESLEVERPDGWPYANAFPF
jgi:hypothetical protein